MRNRTTTNMTNKDTPSGREDLLADLTRTLFFLRRWQLSRTPYWWLVTLDILPEGHNQEWWQELAGMLSLEVTEESTKLPPQKSQRSYQHKHKAVISHRLPFLKLQ